MSFPSALRRSFLIVPGSDERKLSKASGLGADAAILDLEDGVAASRKETAQAAALGFVGKLAIHPLQRAQMAQRS